MVKKQKHIKRQKQTIKEQIKNPMEVKETIDNTVFYPAASGAKVSERSIEISFDGPEGHVELKIISTLNQSHRDILNTIMALAYQNGTYIVHRIGYYKEIYYAVKWSDLLDRYGKNTKWILKHIEDMRKTSVALSCNINGERNTIVDGMISKYGFMSTQKNYGKSAKEKVKEIIKTTNIKKQTKEPNPNWFKPKEGDIFWVTVSFNWLAPIDLSRKVKVNYSVDLLDKLRKEKSGLIIALTKFIITQKVGFHIYAENLLEKVKPDWNKLSQRRQEQLIVVLNKKIDNFKEYNINYNPDNRLFCYNISCKGVGFSISTPENRKRTIKGIEQYKKDDKYQLM